MKIFIDATDEYVDAKMHVNYRGWQFTADTAVALIDEIKEMDWDIKFYRARNNNEEVDAEKYIEIKSNYKKPWSNRKLEFPDGDTETRAIAMFKQIHDLGGWQFEMEE